MKHFKQSIVKLFILASILFIISYIFRYKKLESFLNFPEFQRYFQQIKKKSEGQEKYDEWIGYVYGNSETSANILNDFKSRAFQPTCLFRRDWSQNLPSGKQRPIPAKTKELATMAYLNTLQCLAARDSSCTGLLDDFRSRFFEPGCEFKNPSNTQEYVANYQVTFK